MNKNIDNLGKYKKIHIDYCIWLKNDEDEKVLGDYRWSMLKAIERTGSLMSAANELGLSYRKIWGDLKATEEALGFTLVEKKRGGENGGFTSLTEDGKLFIEAYEEFHKEFQSAVHDVIKKFKRKLKYGEE